MDSITALEKACEIINKRTLETDVYKRGFNDCFALLAVYDQELRLGYSKVKEIMDFEYDSPSEFLRTLRKKGFTLNKFAEYCGYQIIADKRPMSGDIAYEHGSAMIASDKGWWVTTSDYNEGIKNARQIMFVERRLGLLARPIRS